MSFTMMGTRGTVRHRIHPKGKKNRPKRHKLTTWQWLRMKLLDRKLPERPRR